MKQTAYLQINKNDNVVVCLRAMHVGEEIKTSHGIIHVLRETPAGHKILLYDTDQNEPIIKYGYPIGHAKEPLKAGEWVNEKNIKTNLSGTLEYEYQPRIMPLEIEHEDRHFKGFLRRNGEVGIRNEIWIVPTVGCVNGIAERLARQLEKETQLKGIDGIHA